MKNCERRAATGQIISRCLNADGRPIGTPHINPKLNSCLFNIKFKDGTTDIILANQIADKIWNQVDQEDYSQAILHYILDYKFSNKAVKGDLYVTDCKGRKRLCKTVAG